MNRRQFLKAFGVTAVTAVSLQRILTTLPDGALIPPPKSTAERHAIERLTFGVTPALYRRAREVGAAAFVEEQLSPEQIDDSAVKRQLEPYREILNENAGVLIQRYEEMRNEITQTLLKATATRALDSKRQLYERMAHFWSNHFYICGDKGVGRFLKIDDDRDAIRPHAMGKFRELLGASAHSPAMLGYLDNASNTRDGINENYARELMELHTLGVNGGYSEQDVKEVARCFTGWSATRPGASEDCKVVFRFRSSQHDNDAKSVLDRTIPAGGAEQDGEIVLDLLASHPSTARFISSKIARRFVSDAPPPALVERMAATFSQSGGEITDVLRTLFAGDEFWNAPPKLKQPFEYLISVMRALDFEVTNARHFAWMLNDSLRTMGQLPYSWVTPDGFPDVDRAWMDGLLVRWNIAWAAVMDKLPGGRMRIESVIGLMEEEGVAMQLETMMAFAGRYLFGRALSDKELPLVTAFASEAEGDLQTQVAAGMALLMASPAFQFR